MNHHSVHLFMFISHFYFPPHIIVICISTPIFLYIIIYRLMRYTYLLLLTIIILTYHLNRFVSMYIHIYMHTHVYIIPLFPISTGKAALFSSGDS